LRAETVDGATLIDGVAVAKAVRADVAELTAGLTRSSLERPFRSEWLARGRFELVAVVNRLDRRAFDPQGAPSCGEARLVYRLALAHAGRPPTRLPMTVNLRIAQAADGAGPSRCVSVARRWRAAADVLALLRALPPPSKLEINFQSIHVPSTRTDMDDNAEYVQRTFALRGDSLTPEPLFDTPRADLAPESRRELARWIAANIDAIDEGRAVVPGEFLATRTVSRSPRGLVHRENAPVSRLFAAGDGARVLAAALRDASGAAGDAGARAALSHATLARTTELLLRRLDEGTCPGCHQSRGVAGFHLLGEERDPDVTFNALAVGHSPHLAAELPWRAAVLADAADGVDRVRPRPFSGRPDGPGAYGAECGLGPGFASWTCAPGLVCRDLHGGDVGVCAPSSGTKPGDPCEPVTVEASARPERAFVRSAGADATCPAPIGDQASGLFCAPNWLGFTGGMCSERCDALGAVAGGAICAPLPSAGYEADCFVSREPVESCLTRHYVRARIATCDAHTPCRDDYACARVPGAPIGTGACIPPYFVFQLRVDGPVLDR
jgi:hypothetical protein